MKIILRYHVHMKAYYLGIVSHRSSEVFLVQRISFQKDHRQCIMRILDGEKHNHLKYLLKLKYEMISWIDDKPSICS